MAFGRIDELVPGDGGRASETIVIKLYDIRVKIQLDLLRQDGFNRLGKRKKHSKCRMNKRKREKKGGHSCNHQETIAGHHPCSYK